MSDENPWNFDPEPDHDLVAFGPPATPERIAALRDAVREWREKHPPAEGVTRIPILPEPAPLDLHIALVNGKPTYVRGLPIMTWGILRANDEHELDEDDPTTEET